MERNVTSISEQFADLLEQYNKKLITPVWFKNELKTLLNKNITIEDWNRALIYIKNCASETETLLKMCKLLATKETATEIIIDNENLVAKEVSKNLSTSRIENNGENITLSVNDKSLKLTDSKLTYDDNEIINESMAIDSNTIENLIK